MPQLQQNRNELTYLLILLSSTVCVSVNIPFYTYYSGASNKSGNSQT